MWNNEIPSFLTCLLEANIAKRAVITQNFMIDELAEWICLNTGVIRLQFCLWTLPSSVCVMCYSADTSNLVLGVEIATPQLSRFLIYGTYSTTVMALITASWKVLNIMVMNKRSKNVMDQTSELNISYILTCFSNSNSVKWNSCKKETFMHLFYNNIQIKVMPLQKIHFMSRFIKLLVTTHYPGDWLKLHVNTRS